MKRLLTATVAAALAASTAKPASLGRVTVNTTVQPTAITDPLDSRLYDRGREILVRLAAKHGIALRQSYQRFAKRALRLASRYAHARQMRRARREIKLLKIFLDRVMRHISRKLAERPALAERFEQVLALVARLRQQKTDRAKLYALHAPEVEYLAKGKPHKRYEFGVKGLGRGDQSGRAHRRDAAAARQSLRRPRPRAIPRPGRAPDRRRR